MKVFTKDESPVNELAMSTISILTSNKSVSDFKNKPISLKCPRKH